MSRCVSVLVSAVCVLALAGCGDSNTVAGPAATPTPAPIQAATPIATPTTTRTATPTPSPTPGPAVTIVIGVRAWDFSPGGPVSPPLTLQVGVTYILVFHNVDAPGTVNARHGFSGISELGLPSTDDISAGHDFVIPSFTPQAYQRGAHPFVCTQSNCGGDPEQHAGMIGSLIVQ
jgi:hypothetical protein